MHFKHYKLNCHQRQHSVKSQIFNKRKLDIKKISPITGQFTIELKGIHFI